MTSPITSTSDASVIVALNLATDALATARQTVDVLCAEAAARRARLTWLVTEGIGVPWGPELHRRCDRLATVLDEIRAGFRPATAKPHAPRDLLLYYDSDVPMPTPAWGQVDRPEQSGNPPPSQTGTIVPVSPSPLRSGTIVPDVSPPPDALRTPTEAARKLRCSIKTLNGHVASGALGYVIIGHGRKRPRKMFTDGDLDAFIEAQTRKEVPCPSTASRARHTGISTSTGEVIDFRGPRRPAPNGEAEKIETAERERAKQLVAQLEQAKTSLRLQDVASRYWTEHAQHLAGAPNTWTLLGIVIDYFGKDKLITEISDDDVARFVAWRRGHRVRENGPLISNFTVNHTTTTLRKLFTRCKLWGVRFAHEPKWTKHLLKVPAERVRELSDDEAARIDAAMRGDYAPFFEFARITGWRLAECLLQWSDVDFASGQISRIGKGGKRITRRITSDLHALLWPLQGHHPESVFTYICERGEHGRVKGQRYPITYAGVQTFWRRLRKRSGMATFRFHDYRHDFGTKLLRRERNLRLVQKALHHASIKTTMRYAHVLDEEVADALERAAKSRAKSRTRLKVV